MNCRDFQDELILWFGGDLPEDRQAHVETCPECRDFWNQLVELQAAIPGDQEFYPSSAEAERLSSRVMQSLPPRSRPGVSTSWRHWLSGAMGRLLRPRPLGAAAVSVFLLAFGLWWVSSTPGDPIVDSSTLMSELSPGFISDTTLYEPESETVDLLVDGLAVLEPTTAARSILDDLSDEEYQYLAKNLTVEDIL